MTARLTTVTDETIDDAVDLIAEGGLVVLPTETVYGLAANALDGQAVARIFEAKGRPKINPLIVHVHDLEAAQDLVEFNEMARTAAHAFWPGPLTLILPRRDDCPVSELCSAGLPTLAVRVPAHPVAQDVLKKLGKPVAAPSANVSGKVSATTPAYVMKTLGDKVDMILAAGAAPGGLESTVVDVSEGTPVILRPGAVTANDLAAVLNAEVIMDQGDQGTKNKPRSPGQILRHYAPAIPIRLNAVDVRSDEALLAFGSIKFMGVKGGGAASDLPQSRVRNLSEDGDLTEAAANLFRMIDELDQPEHEAIAVMNIPDQGLGIAINNRLRKAAQASEISDLPKS